MKLILNLAFLLIILLCTWAGYKKGLILGVCSLLAIVISMYGANLLSTTYSYEVVDALRPFASGYVETTINRDIRAQFGIEGSTTASLSVEDYLASHPEDKTAFCQSTFEKLGLYPGTAETLAGEAVDYAELQEMPLVDSLVEVLCQRITYVAGFLIFFLLILIILTVLGNLTNLSFKIPNMDILNDYGGLAAGALQGLFFCFLLAWILRFTGIVLPQAGLEHSFLVSGLMKLNIVSAVLGI